MFKYLKEYNWADMAQVMANGKLPPDTTEARLDGKLVVITGATSGVGLAAVRRLHLFGADILMINRNSDKSAALAAELRATGPGKVDFLTADFSSLAQTARVARQVLDYGRPVDVLINNAGIHSTTRQLTDEGFETVFVVNHLSSFLLTRAILPFMAGGRGRGSGDVGAVGGEWGNGEYRGPAGPANSASSGDPAGDDGRGSGEPRGDDGRVSGAPTAGRIIQVNSQGHRFFGLNLGDLDWARRPYMGLRAYGAAKTAQLLCTWEFADRLASAHDTATTTAEPRPTIVAMHPGAVLTNVGNNNGRLYRWFQDTFVRKNLDDVTISGLALHYLAAAPHVEGVSGKFFNLTHLEKPAPHALDRELGRQVWKVSNEIVDRYWES